MKRGQTDADTRETLKMEKKTERARLNGPMAINTLEVGKMGSSMALAFGLIPGRGIRGRASGSMAKGLNGYRGLK